MNADAVFEKMQGFVSLADERQRAVILVRVMARSEFDRRGLESDLLNLSRRH